MNGGVLVFYLLVMLFGWRWLSAVLDLSGHFTASQPGLWPLSCSELWKSSSFLLQLAPRFCVRVDLTDPRSSLCRGTQGRKTTSTVIKLLT